VPTGSGRCCSIREEAKRERAKRERAKRERAKWERAKRERAKRESGRCCSICSKGLTTFLSVDGRLYCEEDARKLELDAKCALCQAAVPCCSERCNRAMS
jgi:hypothetical protein